VAAESLRIPDFAVSVTSRTDGARPRFSICTLVTRHSEYAEMVESFVSHGFTPADCEYLYIDNSESNCFDAFRGCNLFLSEARGDFIVLCHQDLLLLEDGRVELEQRLSELTAHEPEWALCGNAGGVGLTRLAIRISDRYEENRFWGPFPARVTALDENFIVVRRDANLALPQDLSSFYFYGADLCIVADLLGRSAWVIDFHLRHNGVGSAMATKAARASFYNQRDVVRKYQRAFRSRWIVSTYFHFFLSRSPIASRLLNARAVSLPALSLRAITQRKTIAVPGK